MAKNCLFRTLSRIVDIKLGEGRIAFLLFFYFFFITASYGIIKPLRNASYLREHSAAKLPIAYLLTAIFMGIVVAVHSKLQVRLSRRKLILSTLVFFGLSSIIFAFLFFSDQPWVALVFFIWANAFIMVLITQFFIVLNDVFNPREAKRLIGFLVSGGILGGIIGNLLVGFLDFHIHDYLLFTAFGMILINTFIAGSIFSWKKKYRPEEIDTVFNDSDKEKLSRKVGFKDCFDTVLGNSYLRLIAAVVTITLVVSTLIDWQYNTIVEVSKRPALYATWFGIFNAAFLVVSFLFQLLMTSNIIKRFGIKVTLLVYPAILFICALLIGPLPSLHLALLIKGSDQGLSFSLNQSVRELLYIPVSSELKYKAKVFIDMFLNRFAKSVGALILMVVMSIHFTGPSDQESFFIWKPRIFSVSIISLIFIIAWIFLNMRVSQEYASTVKAKLKTRWKRADKIIGEKLDVNFMKLVLDTLENKERSSILYAMDVFDLIQQDRLSPEVRKLIGYKQDELRASSIGSLIEESEIGMPPQIEDTVYEENIVMEIKNILSMDVYQEIMSKHAQEILKDETNADVMEKMEMARAIGFMEPHSPLAEKLDELLRDNSVHVSRYAMDSAAKLKRREYVSALIEKLKYPQTREDAKSALSKFGSKIVGTLADYLADRDEDIELRKGVIAVLAQIGNQEAINFLIWELTESKNQTDREIIDALDLIRSKKTGLLFEQKAVKKMIFKRIQVYYRELLAYHKSLKGDKWKEIKPGEMPSRFSRLLSDIFKLTGLIYSHEDISKAEQNIRIGTKEATAYAVEMLDHVLKKDLKDVLFPLIENISISERLERCRILLASYPAFKVPNEEQIDS